MITNDDHSATSSLDRYRTIEYSGATGPVTIIQDRERERAWIQSDVRIDVRQ